MEVRTAQQLVWKNKQTKGFNTSDVTLEMCFLQGELTEFFTAWRSRSAETGEELADVAIYLLGLAEMVGVDLQSEIVDKIAKNEQRIYKRQNGILVKESTNNFD